MSDELRQHIAAIIESVGTIDGCCADLAAKAVIRELGLEEELTYGGKMRRYVTDWKADE